MSTLSSPVAGSPSGFQHAEAQARRAGVALGEAVQDEQPAAADAQRQECGAVQPVRPGGDIAVEVDHGEVLG
ncbi:hypothetical protein F3K40_01340 [Streptomyces sp. LBUM 1478]|nr:hypothetical protein [Streptomyces sp. LBUM 1478]